MVGLLCRDVLMEPEEVAGFLLEYLNGLPCDGAVGRRSLLQARAGSGPKAGRGVGGGG